MGVHYCYRFITTTPYLHDKPANEILRDRRPTEALVATKEMQYKSLNVVSSFNYSQVSGLNGEMPNRRSSWT